MIRATASRQLWSSLRTWERKPQVVVTGLKTRSRYRTPCSSRASWMRDSVRTSAEGSPSLRAKRARSWSMRVMGSALVPRDGLIERCRSGREIRHLSCVGVRTKVQGVPGDASGKGADEGASRTIRHGRLHLRAASDDGSGRARAEVPQPYTP